MPIKIAILGAGIIGTCTAYRLLDARPDLDVTILSKDFSPNTTSDGAAGYWTPYFSVGTPEETIRYRIILTCANFIKNFLFFFISGAWLS